MPTKSLRLTEEHIEFLNKHPEVNFSALARQALDHRMEVQKVLDEIAFSGSLREVQDDLEFQVQKAEKRVEQRSDELPVTIEVKPIENKNE